MSARHLCFVCDEWYPPMEITYVFNLLNDKILSKEFEYLKDKGDIICDSCMEKIEREFIDSIPLADLVLHVWRVWLHKSSLDYFRRRMNGGS